jgi:thioredoxin-dependent peroxiredoxin
MFKKYSNKKKTNIQKKSNKKCISNLEGNTIPNIIFKTRIKDNAVTNGNPFKWRDVKSKELFKNKKCVVFSLPGAYTPTCSSKHLPGYDKKYNELKKYVDEVYCASVNDAFVMYNWGKQLGIKNIKFLPDGSGLFTKKMGALVKKDNLGFGKRSWRYSMLVDNGKIIKIFSEPGKKDNCKKDPFKVSDVDTMLNYLQNYSK